MQGIGTRPVGSLRPVPSGWGSRSPGESESAGAFCSLYVLLLFTSVSLEGPTGKFDRLTAGEGWGGEPCCSMLFFSPNALPSVEAVVAITFFFLVSVCGGVDEWPVLSNRMCAIQMSGGSARHCGSVVVWRVMLRCGLRFIENAVSNGCEQHLGAAVAVRCPLCRLRPRCAGFSDYSLWGSLAIPLFLCRAVLGGKREKRDFSAQIWRRQLNTCSRKLHLP